ncbi:uncharacterized protein LOC143275729 [Babylonia areolata]|uniref:uncharacterized protein LOC143275729 n=1 Tax=Babylonia areolata TaxID=304850 RepID=UPI003FD4A495
MDLCCLNDKSPTYLHLSSGKLSCLDLSVCDPSLVLDYEWKVHDDLHGSDHFPVVLRPTDGEGDSLPDRLYYDKADWSFFTTKIRAELQEETVLKSKDPADALTRIVLDCAKAAVPSSTSKPQVPRTPWFNAECREARKSRKRAQRRVFRRPESDSVRTHQQLRAKARYVFKKSQRKSWRDFCSSLTSNTPKKKVWRVLKRIKGKNACPTFHHLKLSDALVTEKKAVANLLASTIEQNSRSANKSARFLKTKNLLGQGTVEGGRKRGRQRKSWYDNIKEWTDMTLPDLLVQAEDRVAWRRTSVSSALRSPQRLPK